MNAGRGRASRTRVGGESEIRDAHRANSAGTPRLQVFYITQSLGVNPKLEEIFANLLNP